MVQKTRIGSLNFDDIKASIKNYLKDQTEFSDYNFEGSNISQLINILAYNAHYDALSANFLANEVFLDTATKRSSVVSRAKELGYTPRSRRASSTTITMAVRNVANQDTIPSIVLPQGTRFSTTVNEETFTFTTKEALTLNKTIELGQPVFRGTFKIYEGILLQHTMLYNTVDTTVTIPNVDIDTTTLKVEVLEGLNWVEYTQPQNFLTVLPTSTVYMLQEGFKGFEIYFGDNTLGKTPTQNSNIRMTYVVTSGSPANGAYNFSLASAITGQLSNTVITITADANASGGQLEESIESIRLNAKNTFGSQNRAVTSSDYAALAIQNFSSIKNVLAWDGSDNTPPKFGKVVLCVQPSVGDVLTTTDKTLISEFLVRKGVGNVKVDFVDPEYLFVELYSTVKYNINTLTVGTYELEYIVKSAITSFASSSIQKFKGSLRYSSLLAAIDNSDYSITGNQTYLKLIKEFTPNLFSTNNFNYTYDNAITAGSVLSTGFYDGKSDNRLYLKDLNGKIHVYYSMNGVDTLYIANAGTINYVTGAVVISNLEISSIEGIKFDIKATPINQDIYSTKNIILGLRQENIKVSVIKDN